MAEHTSVRRPAAGDPDLEAARGAPRADTHDAAGLPGHDRARRSASHADPPVATPGPAPFLPVAALAHLQRAAGNAAVVQLLRGPGAPTAPPAPAAIDRDEEAGAVVEEAPAPEDLLGSVETLEEGERPSPEMRTGKRAEGEGAPLVDDEVQVGGGGFPFAGPAASAGAFVDGGRADSIPFGDATAEDAALENGDERPRAFVAGGKTGTRAWGGGAGAGPKGNQESGSIQELVVPEYDSSWGGMATNADAWVKEGTGIVTVKRDYLSSSPGDQGNGWYVTDKAAAGLERHEQRHVSKSRDLYVDNIQPMLDRIVQSYSYGKGKAYRSSVAKALVKRYVAWEDAVKGFDEDDKAWNGKYGQVDQEDQHGPDFPRQYGAAKVNGKDFQNLLKMPGEPKPPE